MQEYNTVLGRHRQIIREKIEQALQAAKAAGKLDFEQLPQFVIEKPRELAHGDYASNVAMLLAKPCKKSPRDIAALVVEYIDFTGSSIEKVEIAGPGFLNFRLAEGWLNAVLDDILQQGAGFGSSDVGQGKKIQVEFVSANPTGDLHMGNARGAAIGDSLASILQLAGFEVQREFYINDAGNQIDKFARTLNAIYLQKCGQDFPFPEDGYPGADLPIVIDQLIAEVGDKYVTVSEELRKEYLAEYGLQAKISSIRASLLNFGVEYDLWFSERSLHDGGQIKQVLEELEAGGMLLEQDGALWFDCSKVDENEKPEVVVRANGVPTYFAADIAYHQNKFQRGFDTVIDIWGADHHGHVARMKYAMEAIGYSREQLEIILMQFVRLYQNGELVKMSKRTGQYVTLDELIEDVGKDAARFLFIMRSTDSLIDFDMDLAKSQSAENPVYYVQYAHARICSILRTAEEQHPGILQQTANAQALHDEAEQLLIRRLADFPDEIAVAGLMREPHRIAGYLMELAAQFHNFYAHCHCLVEDEQLMRARLALVESVAGALKNGLNALGVSAPERM